MANRPPCPPAPRQTGCQLPSNNCGLLFAVPSFLCRLNYAWERLPDHRDSDADKTGARRRSLSRKQSPRLLKRHLGHGKEASGENRPAIQWARFSESGKDVDTKLHTPTDCTVVTDFLQSQNDFIGLSGATSLQNSPGITSILIRTLVLMMIQVQLIYFSLDFLLD